jgi:hypothetical protein
MSNQKTFLSIESQHNFTNQKDKYIISFCLFNLKEKRRDYLRGLELNIQELNKVYKGWAIRVHVSIEEPQEIIQHIINLGIEVVLIKTNTCHRVSRYFVYDDLDVKVFISRDTDSIINYREEAAVNEWLDSDCKLHIMADAGSHKWIMAAGMCGIKNDYKINFKTSLIEYNNSRPDQNYQCDASILEHTIFPLYKNSYIQHYSAGHKLDNNKPFPQHKEIDCQFVGSYIV